MNLAQRRWSGLGGFVVASLVPVLLLAVEGKPANPLRQASYAEPVAAAPEAPRSSAATATRRAVPAAVRPGGVELVSHPRAGLTPAHARLAETYISRSELGSGLQYGGPTTPMGTRVGNGEIIGGGIIDGGVIDEGMIFEGDVFFEGMGKGVQGAACCDGGGCLQCCIPCPSLDNFEFFAGVQGFTGPINRGGAGSFGFTEGINWGACFPCSGGELGAQLGARATQSNFSAAEFTGDSRHQTFVTAGAFRRVDWGLQGGAVVDYLHDDWYASASLVQLRGELSWVFPCTHEIGFWFTSSGESDQQTFTLSGQAQPLVETFEPIDLYAFFYRRRLSQMEGAQARFFAGATGDSDGLIGADLRLPIGCQCALECGFTYLIPEEASGPSGTGYIEESWNVAIALVWYPGARSAYGQDYFRPLFNVADNGSFMVNRR